MQEEYSEFKGKGVQIGAWDLVRWRDAAKSKKAETIPSKIGAGDRKSPRFLWGLGHGLPTTLDDLVLLRRAINEDRPVPPNVRQTIVEELAGEVDSPNVRIPVHLQAMSTQNDSDSNPNNRSLPGSFDGGDWVELSVNGLVVKDLR